MIDVVMPLAEAAAQGGSQVAETDPGWWQVILTVVLSLASGFLGGWLVAFRMGGWRQKVESWLAGHDKDIERIDERLGSGKAKLDHVPTLRVQLNAIRDTIEDLKNELQYQREHYVHVRECQKHKEEERDDQD